MKIVNGMLAALVLALILIRPSAADERDHRRGFERDRHGRWHGEIHRFHERDLRIWRGGRWYHGRHSGRLGWWWIVSGIWYFYPAPVYPYPDPYRPPVVIVPPAPPTLQYWYYCSSPPGYYPYVPQCETNWQRVPATVPPGTPR